MKKFTSCICNKANCLVLRARTALSNQRGDFYFFKCRITEVQDEYTLQILFLSTCRRWELAQRHFYPL